MKTLRFALLAMILALPIAASAQTVAATTTLSAAVTATQDFITVASATGFTVGNHVYVEHELMQILSINGTTIRVQRGEAPTRQMAHATSARLFTGAAGPYYFKELDPDYGAACTRGIGQASYLPWINMRTGVVWNCEFTGVWNGHSFVRITYNSTTNGTQ